MKKGIEIGVKNCRYGKAGGGEQREKDLSPIDFYSHILVISRPPN